MTPKTKIVEIEEPKKVLFKGKNAKLLVEAVELTNKKSEITKKVNEETQKIYKKYQVELDEIKSSLENIEKKLNVKTLTDGDYFDKKGNVLTVKTDISYSHPTVEDTKELLKTKRKGRLFNSVVKVQLTPLNKILTKEEIMSLRKELSKTVKWVFK